MTRMILFFATVVIAGSMAAAALAQGSNSTTTLKIQHATKGCHTWALNGGKATATQHVMLAKGATLKVVNNDVMPHRFIQKTGPAMTIVHARMGHMGATATVRFTRHGVYTFKTKAGEDYPGVKVHTIGEDNILRLTVTIR